MLAKTALDLLKPWPLVILIDTVLQGKPAPAWWPALSAGQAIAACVAATVAIFLLSWLIAVSSAYANISLGQRMVYDLASDLFAKLQQLSLSFHARKSVGDNVRRATADCACVSVIVNNALLPAFAAAVAIIARFSIMWRVDGELALLALAVAPLLAAALYFHAAPMLSLGQAQQQVEARLYEITEQTFAAIPAVQAFHRESINDAAFAEACERTVAATAKLTKVQLRFKTWVAFTMAFGTSAIFWIGGRQALAGTASLGTLLLFLSYLASLYDPLATVMYTSATVQTSAGSAARVREILGAENTVTDRPGAALLAAGKGRVEISHVTFGYEAERPVLRDVSLRLEPGEIVALVGASGAGKSTLAALLPRFYDPWQGRVLVDGKDVREVTLSSLRRNIAIVLQEPFLFPLSLAENIAYGRPDASRAEIEAAAAAAHAAEFIERLPEGYATIIGERGVTLSGGERQRLSLARAFLKAAPILILDEPTSALDAASETLVVAALEKLAARRTTLVIAHRLSTIQRATRIVVLQNGVIAETGTHDELLRRGEAYARFHHLQFVAAQPQ
jgi:ATP-binding cassette subfamily B protein/subfamily B ATP-binding cassette protein MsbA